MKIGFSVFGLGLFGHYFTPPSSPLLSSLLARRGPKVLGGGPRPLLFISRLVTEEGGAKSSRAFIFNEVSYKSRIYFVH